VSSSAPPVPLTFIASRSELGGAERVMLAIMDGLGPEWVQSVIVLEDGPVADAARSRGYRVKTIRARRRIGLLTAGMRARRELRRTGARYVHANHFRAAVVAVIATLGTGIRFVWHKHDSTRDGWLAQAIGRRARLIVGVSRTTNETFRGPVRRKLRVVYPGVAQVAVDHQAAKRIVTGLLSAPVDSEVLVVVARLCPPKGQLDLIESAPDLIAARPRLRIAFVGAEAWPYVGYERLLRDRARALRVEHAVAFLGDLSERGAGHQSVTTFIAGSDLLVAPSKAEVGSGWREGFGLAPLEAMSVNVPVVAYEHGSFPEVLGDCAYLVREGDRNALQDAIVRTLEDRTLRSRLTQCGAHRIRRFTPERMLAGMRQVYTELAKDERASR
jgi:glycosyltransferase involved in cell wall biosynthesis